MERILRNCPSSGSFDEYKLERNGLLLPTISEYVDSVRSDSGRKETASTLSSTDSISHHPEYFKAAHRSFSKSHHVFVLPRMRLWCTIYRGNPSSSVLGSWENESGTKIASYQPLNEMLIDRGTSPYLSNLELFIDGQKVTTVQADGLIVSTPTGSSAYSMSAGGALTAPSVAAILVTPICPHSLSFRPLVLPDCVRIRIRLPEGARSTAWVSFDGRGQTELKAGDYVEVVMSRYPLPTITFCEHNTEWFHAIINKLNWNIRTTQKPLGLSLISPSSIEKRSN